MLRFMRGAFAAANLRLVRCKPSRSNKNSELLKQAMKICPYLLLPFVLLLSTARVSAFELSELEGTKWRVVVSGKEYLKSGATETYDIALRAEGRLTTSDPVDKTPDNDTWRVNGKELIFSLNDGFSVYRGRLRASGQIEGDAKNVKGVRWRWSATRVMSSISE